MSEFPIDEWLTTKRAAELSGYVQEYVADLARRGVVLAYRTGRDWLVSREDLLRHTREMAALGTQRHNPWRKELSRDGRGRRH